MKSKALLTAEVLMQDDKRAKCYTGLPSYSVFKAIFDFVLMDLPIRCKV